MRHSRWRCPGRQRGVNEIIGAILLVALTLVAGVILWTFHVRTPPATPSVSFEFLSGSSHPAWGDPTDCQPQGTWTYPLPASEDTAWYNGWTDQCYNSATGNFSVLNASELIVSAVSSPDIPLSSIMFSFLCNNLSTSGGRTVLVNGTLASMVWFPGSTTEAAPNAPTLGYCGSFDAGDYSGVSGLTPANGVLYNRLGMFIPVSQSYQMLEVGDMFVLYIHNGGFPITFLCVAASLGLYAQRDCLNSQDLGLPLMDYDDYHGAPPWCFTSEVACTIQFTYIGNPTGLIANIPVSWLAPPTQ
ncbi:MAG TPA: archaellin/type IV pilin N-terminal domain-containing protein [Thermoplasmata archaeon]|nr:archaellin/type IV pilin N-terminal domain-containing protein [Thermoplasmata archaeon]